MDEDEVVLQTPDQPEQFASPHTVNAAAVGSTLTNGPGSITAFTMTQLTSAATDDLTPLTLVDPLGASVANAAIAAGGTGGTAGTAVYAVVGGTGTPATLNVTVTAGAISAINSVASPGSYSVFPTSPAALVYVSGTGVNVTGATVNLTPAAITAGSPSRVLYSANLRALACEYEPRPGWPLTPSLTAPTWPRSISSVAIPFTNGCVVQSCPANTTFTVTC